MRRRMIVLLLPLLTSACSDPTRVITNKPKSEEQKQQEKVQRAQEDKANTEALRNFRITANTGKKGQTQEPAAAKGEKPKTGKQDQASTQKKTQP